MKNFLLFIVLFLGISSPSNLTAITRYADTPEDAVIFKKKDNSLKRTTYHEAINKKYRKRKAKKANFFQRLKTKFSTKKRSHRLLRGGILSIGMFLLGISSMILFLPFYMIMSIFVGGFILGLYVFISSIKERRAGNNDVALKPAMICGLIGFLLPVIGLLLFIVLILIYFLNIDD